jgi:Ligand-gated ion channel
MQPRFASSSSAALLPFGRSQRLFLLVNILASCCCRCCRAQQAPFTTVTKFDTSRNFRTNICDRQRQLWNGTIDFPDALKGLNLTVVISNYETGKEQNLFTLLDGKIKAEYPGYYAVILDELATRAGFAWRDSFAVVGPWNQSTDGNTTWTDILLWGIEVFDVSMEKWGQSLDRIAAGASFPLGFWDSSLILGEIFQPSQEKRVVNLWSFLEPFEYAVWIMIVVAVIFSGFVYWVLEHWNMDTDELSLETKPLASIFYAAITATGHYELKPNTHAARILGFSFSFWALIVASAYTANLASFLVSPRVAVYKISTVEEAIKKRAVLCVQGGGILGAILKSKYPDVKTVAKGSEQEIFDGLRIPVEDGGCNAVAHQFNAFEIAERSRDVNYDCAISSKKVIETERSSSLHDCYLNLSVYLDSQSPIRLL